jgi:hypothetical protein
MTTTATNTPHITQLREHLLQTLSSLRDRNNPMEPDRARAVAQVASVLVDTAKVEVDYIKVTGAPKSDFIEQPASLPAPSANNPFPVSASHRLEG